ncbi:MAG TPA: ABC transporter permease [Actinomycetota bacterium]|nr:ABC transporter permease [Actinomycetota bacterium]
MRRRRWPLTTAAVLLLLFIYVPLLVVVLYGFNGGSNLSWPPQGVSLRWFRLIFGDDAFRSGLRVSATAALATGAIAVVVGTAAAFAIVRRPNRVARWFESGSRLPVMLPPLFIGIALVAAMKTFAIDPSMLTIIAGHVIITTPFVILIVASRLRNYDLTVEQAARDLGATPRMVLRRITLPLIAPAIFGAMVIACAISFDEVLITNFTSGTTQTLPLFVLSRLRRTIDPSVNAVATILLLVPWVVVGLTLLWQRRRSGAAAVGAPAEELARAA